MIAYTFCIESMVEYQSIWDNALAGGDLTCERETENSHDLQAVAIRKMIDSTLLVLSMC